MTVPLNELGKILKVGLGFITTVLSALLLFSFAALGAEIEYDLVARNFLKHLNSNKPILSARLLESSALDPALPEVAAAYLVNLEGGGYILISTSKSLTPIKAYSLTGYFDTLPPAYREYLLKETEYNIRALATASRSALSVAAGEAARSWDYLLNLGSYKTALTYTPDTYLLTTTWNQNDPYNKFLPETADGKVVAGCVNVAIGQIMKYYAYPPYGKGVAYNGWNGQDLKAVLHRPYNWENMPDALFTAPPEYKIDEVALLLRDLGIANHTYFDTDGSSTSENINALIHNFGYSKGIMEMDNSNATDFFNTLKGEIDALRPVLLIFPGHMTVADGYSEDGSGKKFHVNMGWGGHYDDYYYLDQNIQTDQFNFVPDLRTYFNILPCDDSECFVNLEAGDSIAGTDITGKFDYALDEDRYEIYLKGATVISGSRGFSNQAFFISVYDSNNIRRFSIDESLSATLTAGRYTIRASLQSESSATYPYDGQNVDYSISIATDPLSAVEKTAIDADLDFAPAIYNTFKDLLLNSDEPTPHKILIDARDENGDPLTLEATSTHPGAVQALLSGNVLSLTPVPGTIGIASKIVITASAANKTAEKSFIAMVTNQSISYGREFAVNGTFEGQEDFNTHKIILDGSCTIAGYNGYLNQAFFSSVLSSDGNTILSPVDADITGSFSTGIYLLGASLKEYPGEVYGSYYAYIPGEGDHYQLTVSCPDADENPAHIAALLGIDLGGTDSQGDLNRDGAVNLADGIIGLQVLTGMTPTTLLSDYTSSRADVNMDGRLGLEEVVFILQKVSAMK